VLKIVLANPSGCSLRAKRRNLFFTQDKLLEAISHLGSEIAMHLSGALNDTFISRLRELPLDLCK